MRIKRLNSQHGYTFLESLFQLTVIMIAAPIIMFILMSYFQSMNLKVVHDELEWELFVMDVNMYLGRGHTIYMDNIGKRIEFKDPLFNDQIYYIEVHNDHIIRRADKGGFEIILPNVTYAKFERRNGYIDMDVVMKDGKLRERSFAYAAPK